MDLTIMNNTLLKYSVIFLTGALVSYLVIPQTESPTLNTIANPNVPLVKPTVDSTSINIIDKGDNTFVDETRKTEQDLLLKCNEEINLLTKKLQTSPHLQPDENLNNNIHQKLIAQLKETKIENAILKNKLDHYKPSNVSYEKIKALVPEEYAVIASSFSGEIKEQIVEFHQEEEDQDWGYRKQQELLDFISTHQNAPEVLITSLTCKVDQCELILTEKITAKSLKESGLNDEEVKNIIETQQPKYKQIFDDIKLQPSLNLRRKFYTPNRFGLYSLLKVKTS